VLFILPITDCVVVAQPKKLGYPFLLSGTKVLKLSEFLKIENEKVFNTHHFTEQIRPY
jgi:hypothetical protein